MTDKIHIIQTKLNSLEQKGAVWAMVDLLRLFDSEVYGNNRYDDSDEYYLSYIMKLQKSYATILEEQSHLKKDSKQIDLEDAIREKLERDFKDIIRSNGKI